MFTRKASKGEVNYSPSGPHGDRCGDCKHYVKGFDPDQGICQKVSEEIRSDYWCRLFEAK